MKRIVVVGGGFGGLHLLRHLERRLRRGEAEVTVVDRSTYSLFTPLLYQVATGELPAHAVAQPLRAVTGPAGFRLLRSEVEAIDLEARVVRTADGPLGWDVLALAPGAVSNAPAVRGAERYALGLKDLRDAEKIRRHVLGAFERHAAASDEAARQDLLRFVVVGAGPTGVELAASLRELVDQTLRPLYPHVDTARDVSLLLLDGGDRPLQSLDPRLSAIATRRLAALRITLAMRTTVAEVTAAGVRTTQGALHPAGTVIWTGGVAASPLVAALDLPHAQSGRLAVDPGFRTGGRDDVFAFGDAACFVQDGRPLPQLAQVAVLQAPRVAGNVVRALRGEAPVPYRHHPKGELIALGRRHAAAEVGGRVFGGVPAWTVWRVAYLLRLVGARERATLLAEWALSYLYGRSAADTP